MQLGFKDVEIKLVKPVEEFLGTDYMAVDLKDNFVYVDNKLTDKKDGYKVEIVLPQHKYDKTNVKVANVVGEFVPGETKKVVFEGLQAKPYTNVSNNGFLQFMLSLSADTAVFE